MKDTESIRAIAARKAETAVKLAKEIWDYAEISYEEWRSSAALIAALEAEGFAIETGIADIPTAFTATWTHGTGKPVVGLLAEYDALDGLSQKAACTHREPVTPGGHGHGCGHNLLGAGSYAAAVTLFYALTGRRRIVPVKPESDPGIAAGLAPELCRRIHTEACRVVRLYNG